MRKTYILIFLCFVTSYLYGQEIIDTTPVESDSTGNVCTQNLRIARALYEEGKLNEIPNILKECLRSGFSLEEKVEAYRFLTITYLYLDEPAKADEAMLSLLSTNPEYKVSEDLDPAEYINLYKSFRTSWIFRAGIRFGGLYSIPHVTEVYSISTNPGSYGSGAGFQVALFAEFALIDKVKLQPELFYTSKKYSYQNDNINYSETGGSAGSILFDRNLNYFELFITGKYVLFPGKNYYVSLSPGVGYLFGAEQNGTEVEISGDNQETPGFSLTEPEIDLFNKINPQLMIGAGTEFKVGRGLYVAVDLRYVYSFSQLVKEENRLNIFNSTGIMHSDSNHKLNSLSLSIGIMKAIYIPKKLVE